MVYKLKIYDSKIIGNIVEIYKQNPIKGVALLISLGSLDGLNNLRKEINKRFKSKDKANLVASKIYAEYLSLYIHLLNRALFNEIGDKYSNKVSRQIIHPIIDEAINDLKNLNNLNNLENLMSFTMDILNSSENTYSDAVSYNGNEYGDPSAIVTMFRKKILYDLEVTGNYLEKAEIDIKLTNLQFLTMIKFENWSKGIIVYLGLGHYSSISLFN